MWQKYLVEPESSAYASFRAALEALLSLSLDSLADGLTELEHADSQTTFAHHAAEQFLAVRHASASGIFEAFYVKPASRPPQLGLAIQRYSGQAPSIPPAFVSLVPHDAATAELPTFLSLAKLLLARGGTVHPFSQGALQLASENEYLKQLLAEQSDLYRQAKAALRERNLAMQASTEAAVPQPPADARWSLESLSDWCVAHEESIVVLPRARNGAKKSRYEDPALMGVALELLAGPYRNHRMGLITREAFEDALQATGLKLSGAVGATIAGEQGDAYFVPWGGRRRLLDMHLLKGGGRDERYCFRLYFFWDDVSQRAIVGSMPAHLSCSFS